MDTRNDDRGRECSVTKPPRANFVDFTVVTGYRDCFLVAIGIWAIGMAIAGLDRRGNRLVNTRTTTEVTAPTLGGMGGSHPGRARGPLTYGGALEHMGSVRVDQHALSGAGDSHGVPRS